MFILSLIASGAGAGALIGEAIAVIAGASVSTGTAIGTLTGGGLGLAAGLVEMADDDEPYD